MVTAYESPVPNQCATSYPCLSLTSPIYLHSPFPAAYAPHARPARRLAESADKPGTGHAYSTAQTLQTTLVVQQAIGDRPLLTNL